MLQIASFARPCRCRLLTAPRTSFASKESRPRLHLIGFKQVVPNQLSRTYAASPELQTGAERVDKDAAEADHEDEEVDSKAEELARKAEDLVSQAEELDSDDEESDSEAEESDSETEGYYSSDEEDDDESDDEAELEPLTFEDWVTSIEIEREKGWNVSGEDVVSCISAIANSVPPSSLRPPLTARVARAISFIVGHIGIVSGSKAQVILDVLRVAKAQPGLTAQLEKKMRWESGLTLALDLAAQEKETFENSMLVTGLATVQAHFKVCSEAYWEVIEDQGLADFTAREVATIAHSAGRVSGDLDIEVTPGLVAVLRDAVAESAHELEEQGVVMCLYALVALGVAWEQLPPELLEQWEQISASLSTTATTRMLGVWVAAKLPQEDFPQEPLDSLATLGPEEKGLKDWELVGVLRAAGNLGMPPERCADTFETMLQPRFGKMWYDSVSRAVSAWGSLGWKDRKMPDGLVAAVEREACKMKARHLAEVLEGWGQGGMPREELPEAVMARVAEMAHDMHGKTVARTLCAMGELGMGAEEVPETLQKAAQVTSAIRGGMTVEERELAEQAWLKLGLQESKLPAGLKKGSYPEEVATTEAQAEKLEVPKSSREWLRLLHAERMKRRMKFEWIDEQLFDQTWRTTLVVNGESFGSQGIFQQKQAARDHAAHLYLKSIGICT